MEINKSKCTGCGACVSACPERAISLDTYPDNRKYASVIAERCTDCGFCVNACRFFAPVLTQK